MHANALAKRERLRESVAKSPKWERMCNTIKRRQRKAPPEKYSYNPLQQSDKVNLEQTELWLLYFPLDSHTKEQESEWVRRNEKKQNMQRSRYIHRIIEKLGKNRRPNGECTHILSHFHTHTPKKPDSRYNFINVKVFSVVSAFFPFRVISFWCVFFLFLIRLCFAAFLAHYHKTLHTTTKHKNKKKSIV